MYEDLRNQFFLFFAAPVLALLDVEVLQIQMPIILDDVSATAEFLAHIEDVKLLGFIHGVVAGGSQLSWWLLQALLAHFLLLLRQLGLLANRGAFDHRISDHFIEFLGHQLFPGV